ncbi:MAG TPA: hypothetical protein DIU16_02205 [Candidatus Vogelbacteria bacterium]|uniref:DUF6922 domain-containing protein n=1 Tax=Candidatus Vogelbacteria bacterium RIFOXYD1_FULL_51_18 TaxID=1802440 RepID=A0A1G2QLF7_9BACT|nr:MAG: hypothetical protein A2569_00705 [Candidatus Vogelbacteria bacterium RIFOXYD1_FULL_51_18]HBC44094.1 hypothetical protein [Candidatus Vogelbacteria bacterium]HCQ92159.1 hypothetical protein [Candidatus Vogelbacteria bacterium]
MQKLPQIFKSILWAHDFDKCDPEKMKKTIIIQALSYGTLDHWNWIRSFYGDAEITNILSSVPMTEIRSKTRALIETIFNFNDWNYAPRGSK